MFTRHESELFKDAFPFFVNLHTTDLLKIQSLHDFIKTFIIYQICVFVIVNFPLLGFKFRECSANVIFKNLYVIILRIV